MQLLIESRSSQLLWCRTTSILYKISIKSRPNPRDKCCAAMSLLCLDTPNSTSLALYGRADHGALLLGGCGCSEGTEPVNISASEAFRS